MSDQGGSDRSKVKEKRERQKSFQRGLPVSTKKIGDKKLKGKLKYTERIVREAQENAAKVNDWLLPQEAGSLEPEGMEQTWRFHQEDIVAAAPTGVKHKVFNLQLTELGPYRIGFSRSGRHALIGGRKGHLAMLDCERLSSVCELQVRETVRDVQFLHNETMFAAAQREHVYIYDKRGIELHCLRDHTGVNRLEFLPYHHLLCSVGKSGVLRYQDTSTGHIVAIHKTRKGPCDALTQNPWNAVLCLGHGDGQVTMWTPNLTTPAVKMLCHYGPVKSVAVDPTGRYMATSGTDKSVRVWDIRMYRPLHTYNVPAPVSWMDISQRGLLAIGYTRQVQVWKDALAYKATAPYLNHENKPGMLHDLKFRPYEDVLGIGHQGGVSSILVPGAGEPNYDSYVANPYQTKKQRQEAEVHQLLDKLQPDMIVLDPESVGQVVKEPIEVQKQRQAEAEQANRIRNKALQEKADKKKKMKGKNKPTRRQRKKQQNIIEERKPKIKAAMKEQGLSAERGHEVAEKKKQEQQAKLEGVPRALHRFYK